MPIFDMILAKPKAKAWIMLASPFFGVEVARGFKSQPGADRARAEANEDSGVMEVAAISCLDGQAGERAHAGMH